MFEVSSRKTETGRTIFMVSGSAKPVGGPS
jgi:hypothetical protein